MKQIISSLACAATLLLAACSSDSMEPNSGDRRTSFTANCVMDISIDNYYDETGTRATTSTWADGSRVYIQYQTATGRVDGIATYSENRRGWTVECYGTLPAGQTSKCEVYYFEDTTGKTAHAVTLSQQSALYSDIQASYIYEDGTVTLRAHFKPLMGRLRFHGDAGKTIVCSGLKWKSEYNVTSNTFTEQADKLTLTVGTDGYTPYVYAAFADAERRLNIPYDDDYDFSRSFADNVLAEGKSGYLDIPTMETRNGWQLIDNTFIEFNVGGVIFKMIKVAAGTFTMGSSENYQAYEFPAHQVTLTKDYYMGETEVTQALWYAVLQGTPRGDDRYSYQKWNSSVGYGGNYPAYCVSFSDCELFLSRLNRMTGKEFRFPTEAEWEFAARGGKKSKGYIYAGSNNYDDVAWCGENSPKYNGNPMASEVAKKLPNELGLYDMSGNVQEWCLDWFAKKYPSTPQTDPVVTEKDSEVGSCRVMRGGNYNCTMNSSAWNDIRVDKRSLGGIGNLFSIYGLRLAL